MPGPAFGSVGLGNHPNHRMPASEQLLEADDCKGGGTEEDDPHSLHGDPLQGVCQSFVSLKESAALK